MCPARPCRRRSHSWALLTTAATTLTAVVPASLVALISRTEFARSISHPRGQGHPALHNPKQTHMKILTILLFTTVAFAATPAEMAIDKARADVAKHPDHAPYYNVLAMAYARRARETSDVQYYAKAEETLQRSVALAPDNYEGLKTLAWLQ